MGRSVDPGATIIIDCAVAEWFCSRKSRSSLVSNSKQKFYSRLDQDPLHSYSRLLFFNGFASPNNWHEVRGELACRRHQCSRTLPEHHRLCQSPEHRLWSCYEVRDPIPMSRLTDVRLIRTLHEAFGTVWLPSFWEVRCSDFEALAATCTWLPLLKVCKVFA